jgi:acetyl esterase
MGAARRAAYGQGPEVAAVEDLRIPTRDGSIAGRLFRPFGDPAGLVVYLHGGGWITGSLDEFDLVGRALARRSGCSVLLADYRLAPEHPFPAALLDTQDALRWAARHLSLLALDGKRLVVAGDSAGGNLATVAALELRQELALALQVLFYPVTDCDTSTECYRTYGLDYPLTRRSMRCFFDHYAGGHATNDPRIAPMRTHDLRSAPAAWIATAEYDVLRDEAEAYAARLREAGVHVETRRYAGLAHGFARLFNLVDTADQAMTDAAVAIAQACRTSG